MGIKVYCPNGHKLNVKSFLAGKTGICPHCGAKFEIPVGAASDSAKRSSTTAAPPAPPKKKSSRPKQRTSDLLPKPAVPLPTAAGLPAGGNGAPAPTSFPLPLPNLPAFAPLPAPVQPGMPLPSFAPAPLPVVGAAGLAPPPVTTSPEAPAASDPFAGSSTAAWYVRLPAGDQFGPAPSDVMRAWVQEGRVTPDALVWREGWPEWQPSTTVFTQLAGDGDAPGGAPVDRVVESSAIEEDWLDAVASEAPTVVRRHVRKQAVSQTKVISIALGILFGLLLLLVCIVIYQKSHPPEPSEPQPPAATQPAAPAADETAK